MESNVKERTKFKWVVKHFLFIVDSPDIPPRTLTIWSGNPAFRAKSSLGALKIGATVVPATSQ
jgi:hypothetical protein